MGIIIYFKDMKYAVLALLGVASAKWVPCKQEIVISYYEDDKCTKEIDAPKKLPDVLCKDFAKDNFAEECMAGKDGGATSWVCTAADMSVGHFKDDKCKDEDFTMTA